MSDEATIKDRPYPFEVKTAILQLVGLAIGTPKDVADINLEIKTAWDNLEVSVYPGGYDSNRNSTAKVRESFYLDGQTPAAVVTKIEAVIGQINAAIADGRKLKAQRLRSQAEELMNQAAAIENAGSVP